MCCAVVGTFLATGSSCFAKTRRRIGQPKSSGLQDVILIRGAAGGVVPYWPGAPDLARHMHSLGYAPTIINHFEYAKVADEIVIAQRTGRLNNGLTIIGYSFGGDVACLLADRLGKKGVRVENVILIESTWGTSVPGNVDRCINFYKSRPLDFIPASRGIPVVARDPQTELTNINVGDYESLSDLAKFNHFTLGNSHRLHGLVGEFAISHAVPEFERSSTEALANSRRPSSQPAKTVQASETKTKRNRSTY